MSSSESIPLHARRHRCKKRQHHISILSNLPFFTSIIIALFSLHPSQYRATSAFRPPHHNPYRHAKDLRVGPDIIGEVATAATAAAVVIPDIIGEVAATATTSVVEDGGGGSVESWRQYVPLGVSVVVIIDILLGSPLANLALAPMKRASEEGSGGDAGKGGGGSLFSAEDKALSRSKERVDTEAIAQATLDKAVNTLELRRFLEENKTDEQRFEDMRKKIDRQISEDQFD